MTPINIMIIMAAVHLSLIVTYHIITYMKGGVIRSKIKFSGNLLARITRLHKKTLPQQFQLRDNIRNNIPEVVLIIMSTVNH